MQAPGGEEHSAGPAREADLVPPVLLAARLRRAIVLLRRQVRRDDPSGLSIAQVSALATVARCGPVGVGHLAEAEVLPSPAVTRLADRLEEAGLITRRPNPADRRGVLLVVTEAGRELIARHDEAGNAWLAERLHTLPECDRLALERAVEVLESLAGERDRDNEVGN
jgi:DNA-binding MarR family transcriptional regulator